MGNFPIDSSAAIKTPSNTSSTAHLCQLPTHLLFELLVFADTRDVALLGVANRYFAAQLSGGTRSGWMFWRNRWKGHFEEFWNCPFVTSIRIEKRIPDTVFPSPDIANPLLFVLEFSYSYANWLLAGYNTAQKCFVCYEKSFFDLTDFLSVHPGSTETLTEHSGGDISVIFREIGHSAVAAELRGKLVATPEPHAPSIPSSIRTTMSKQKNIATRIMQQRMALGGSLHAVEIPQNIVTSFPSEYTCPLEGHIGEARVYFDPLHRVWCGWCSVCCQGGVLMKGGVA